MDGAGSGDRADQEFISNDTRHPSAYELKILQSLVVVQGH